MTDRIALVGLIAAGVLLAVPAAQAFSPRPYLMDGFVSVAGGNDRSVIAYTPTINAQGLYLRSAASAAYDFSGGTGLQGDILVRAQDINTVNFGKFNERSIDVTIHGYHRQTGQYLLGVIGQYGDTLLFNSSTPPNTFENTRGYAGLEAQFYLQDLTFYVQAGVQDGRYWNYGATMSGSFANLEARYFPIPNLKLFAHAGIERLANDSDELAGMNAGVGAEYQLADAPISVFARYDFARVDNLEKEISHDNRFLVGVKINFGTQTLEARDRTGATLIPIETATSMLFNPPI